MSLLCRGTRRVGGWVLCALTVLRAEARQERRQEDSITRERTDGVDFKPFKFYVTVFQTISSFA